MSDSLRYIPNGGQTYQPVQDNIHVPFKAYDAPVKPSPLLPPLELSDEAVEKGYALPSQKQHFLPGVTAEMMDWFWANMEKCYYLWAPGSHKKFSWVRSPAEYGMGGSALMIAESCEPGLAVFGGEGVTIERLPFEEFYPFKTCLAHAICEGVYNDKRELVDSTIHLWEDTEGGLNHITATVSNTRCSMPPSFVLEVLKADPNAKLVPNWATEHEDYEASQWPVFLPTLYGLWKDHPDPSQNVFCDLTVIRGADGKFRYARDNGPVTLAE